MSAWDSVRLVNDRPSPRTPSELRRRTYERVREELREVVAGLVPDARPRPAAPDPTPVAALAPPPPTLSLPGPVPPRRPAPDEARPSFGRVAERFCARLAADPVLGPLAAGRSDLPAAVEGLLDTLAAGPTDVRPLARALAAVPLEPRHVDRAARLLDLLLRAEGVPEATRQTVLARVAELGPSVVNAPDRVAALREAVAPFSLGVGGHTLYATIRTIEDVRTFMEHHVYAVWDFMCLLKALQRSLTSVGPLWTPVGDASTRRLINEIVVGEESDVDRDGRVLSHFELYVEGMREVGADTAPILRFVDLVRNGTPAAVAMEDAGVPAAARTFVTRTLEIVSVDRPHAVAAAFTLGREELIPSMFLTLVHELNERFPGSLATFTYYLERHIEVDGGEHAKAAMDMLENLCGADAARWNEAAGTAIVALRARRELWDGVEEAIRARRAARPAREPHAPFLANGAP